MSHRKFMQPFKSVISIIIVLIMLVPNHSVAIYDDEEVESGGSNETSSGGGLGELFKFLGDTSGDNGETSSEQNQSLQKPVTVSPADSQGPAVQKDGMAELYLYRNMRSIFTEPEAAIARTLTWTVNGKVAGKFSGSSYIKVDVEPGDYTVKASIEGRPEYDREYSLEVLKKGQSIYLRYTLPSSRKAKLYPEESAKARDEVAGLSATVPSIAQFAPAQAPTQMTQQAVSTKVDSQDPVCARMQRRLSSLPTSAPAERRERLNEMLAERGCQSAAVNQDQEKVCNDLLQMMNKVDASARSGLEMTYKSLNCSVASQALNGNLQSQSHTSVSSQWAEKAKMDKHGKTKHRSDITAAELVHHVKEDNYDKLKSLLAAGANVNARIQPDGHTALTKASGSYAWNAEHEQEKTRMINLLLDHGADPNLPGHQNLNAVYWHLFSCWNMKCLEVPESFKLLFTKGDAALEVRDNNSYTPILYAADKGLVAHMEYLASLGADITATTEWGDNIDTIFEQKGKQRYKDYISHHNGNDGFIKTLSILTTGALAANSNITPSQALQVTAAVAKDVTNEGKTNNSGQLLNKSIQDSTEQKRRQLAEVSNKNKPSMQANSVVSRSQSEASPQQRSHKGVSHAYFMIGKNKYSHTVLPEIPGDYGIQRVKYANKHHFLLNKDGTGTFYFTAGNNSAFKWGVHVDDSFKPKLYSDRHKELDGCYMVGMDFGKNDKDTVCINLKSGLGVLGTTYYQRK